ncbi:MAG: hypothetical protein FJ304_11980 [Planctomycetes bacterium]|nr:hypothetical protein [Planctomycetota bacterium]
MNDNDPTRTSPPEEAATRSRPAASLPSANATASLSPPVTGTGATISAVGDGSAAAHSEVPDVPGYELGEEVGRGAMGVVYKARNLRLNRTVALKMVLTEQGDSRRMIRFLAEAEAVAAVKHPHVVQVFEFGEATGRPFIAFEYLSGDKLTTRLGTPLLPKDAAELLAKIARGVAAAHDQGIVHRDLKPSNILFDEANVPKVTDFGLAKRGSVSDLTATQAVMGTPAYMAPEQASGNAKFVGPQADVWALGVILYESLTGARPFEADDVQGLLARVIMADPVPPRKRLSAIPRDVELICLKCLSKQPHERYPTAKELADDLDRFVRGEPISVRPAGALVRSYKWVKRNKVVSGATAAVVLALLVGAGISLGFGLEANKQADEAKKQKKEADDAAAREKGETARANREKQDAINARNELGRKTDELNSALARALLGPMLSGDRETRLTPYERAVLWELTVWRGTPVPIKFLAEGTSSPLSSRQLECRAEFAFHAAIGLAPDVWGQADRMLLARFDAPGTTQEQRRSLAIACARAGVFSTPTADRAGAALAVELVAVACNPHFIRRTDEPLADSCAPGPKSLFARESELRALADCLVTVGRRMSPSGAQSVAETLLEAMRNDQWQHSVHLRELARALSGVVGCLESEKASGICDRAVKSLAPPAGYKAHSNPWELAEGLSVVAVRMEPEQAAQMLLSKIAATDNPSTLRQLAFGLASVATRLSPNKAAEVCDSAARHLAQQIGQANYLTELAEGLSALAQYLTPERAAMVCRAPAEVISQAILKYEQSERRHPSSLREQISGLALLVKRLEPEAAVRVLTDTLLRSRRDETHLELAQLFSRVLTRLEPHRAAIACNIVADHLIDFATKHAFESSRRRVAEALAVVVANQSPATAAELLADTLTMQRANYYRFLSPRGLATKTAVRGARASLGLTGEDQVLDAIQTDDTLPDLNAGLEVVAQLAVRTESLRVERIFIEASKKTRSSRDVESINSALNTLRFWTSPTADNPAIRAQTALDTYSYPQFPALRTLIHPQVQLRPKPLPAQDLVELLKHPFCVGEARRAVLDALEFTYKRSFKDQWEFVEYAQKHQPQLDLLTPPKRPEPKP